MSVMKCVSILFVLMLSAINATTNSMQASLAKIEQTVKMLELKQRVEELKTSRKKSVKKQQSIANRRVFTVDALSKLEKLERKIKMPDQEVKEEVDEELKDRCAMEVILGICSGECYHECDGDECDVLDEICPW